MWGGGAVMPAPLEHVVEILFPVLGFWNSSGYYCLFILICSLPGICNCYFFCFVLFFIYLYLFFLPLVVMHHEYLLKLSSFSGLRSFFFLFFSF